LLFREKIALHGGSELALRDVAHEVSATKLAVDDDFEPKLFLALKNAEDLPVFQRVNLLRGNLGAPRIEQLCGTEKTPHVIGAKGHPSDQYVAESTCPFLEHRQTVAYEGRTIDT
jgi:hypothetical protein